MATVTTRRFTNIILKCPQSLNNILSPTTQHLLIKYIITSFAVTVSLDRRPYYNMKKFPVSNTAPSSNYDTTNLIFVTFRWQHRDVQVFREVKQSGICCSNDNTSLAYKDVTANSVAPSIPSIPNKVQTYLSLSPPLHHQAVIINATDRWIWFCQPSYFAKTYATVICNRFIWLIK